MKYIFIFGIYLLYLSYVLCKVVCFSIVMFITFLWGFKIKSKVLKNELEFFNLNKDISFYWKPMTILDYILKKIFE